MASTGPGLRIAVVGHVEHVTLGRVAALPGPGDIAHVETPTFFPGGGGGMAFFQLCRSSAEVHFFTALGQDDAAAQVRARLAATGAAVHAAARAEDHTRDVVLIPPEGDRTIVVVGEPLHPQASDALPWELLAGCDAVYFTAQDPAVLRLCRAARALVVSARRRAALVASGIKADVVVGSALDPREAAGLADFPVPPGALVLTEGPRGGRILRAGHETPFPAPPAAAPARAASYGAGDSFAAALTCFVAAGLPLEAACARAGQFGAAVVGSLDPLRAQLPLP